MQFINHGTTSTFYKVAISQTNSDIDKWQKRPDWIFHHDNAPAHKVLSVKQSALKGQRFQDNEDIPQKKSDNGALKAIPQQQFQKCFQQ
jgi:hypothetical protein